MRQMTVTQFVEKLAVENEFDNVYVEESTTYQSLHQNEAKVKRQVTLRMQMMQEGQTAVNTAQLAVDRDGNIVGATLDKTAPYWAVVAVQETLDIH